MRNGALPTSSHYVQTTMGEPGLEAKGSGSLGHAFIVPELEGPSTGGTVYNARLLSSLSELGVSVRRLALDSVRDVLANMSPCYVWVDSLYIGELPRIQNSCRYHKIGLLAHYLPSLVHKGDKLERADLGTEEQRALDAASAFLVTSQFMRSMIERLSLSNSRQPILVVEPGCSPPRCVTRVPAGNAVSAILVANLTPGKGIEPFLVELGNQVRQEDDFQLKIVGSKDLDKAYALACERLILAHPKLSKCVVLKGAVSPAAVSEEISASSLFVSASKMESFGMALAQARAIGVPVLATAGGNVRAHVEWNAGGELVNTHEQLARSFLDLCRNPEALIERYRAAQQLATPPRCWSDAAKEYLSQIPLLDERMFLQVQ